MVILRRGIHISFLLLVIVMVTTPYVATAIFIGVGTRILIGQKLSQKKLYVIMYIFDIHVEYL